MSRHFQSDVSPVARGPVADRSEPRCAATRSVSGSLAWAGRTAGKCLPAILVSLAALTQSGCVSRRLLVHSNPSGAMVLMEGREVGLTPTGVDFTHYGTRELTLIKDGYETKTQLVPVRAPWYQWPVVEFFSDNLLPGRVTDRRSVQFDLEPKRMVPNQELLNRGQALRNEAQLDR